MSNSVTSATYIRHLSYSLRRKLSDFLDPHDRWKDVIVSIRKPSGDFRYSQHHVRWVIVAGDKANKLIYIYIFFYCFRICLETSKLFSCLVCLFLRRFEALVARGKSPTVELLADWGTTNSTVGELVDILKSQKLLAAACVLLPGMIFFFLSDYNNHRHIMQAYNNICKIKVTQN